MAEINIVRNHNFSQAELQAKAQAVIDGLSTTAFKPETKPRPDGSGINFFCTGIGDGCNGSLVLMPTQIVLHVDLSWFASWAKDSIEQECNTYLDRAGFAKATP